MILEPDALSIETWDAAVIGAGPAGSVAAALLAARGWRVLLIEKSHWPRDKVCGGCLNAAAVASLTQAGLAAALRTAQPIDQVRWHVGHHSLALAAPGGVAILRNELDANLVALAIQRGCHFQPACTAALLPSESSEHRTLNLRSGAQCLNIRARVVLACDGISGSSLANEPWAHWRITRNSWFGASTTLPPSPTPRLAAALGRRFSPRSPPDSLPCDTNTIHMHLAPGGYVGIVQVSPDNVIHLAAALDPAICRSRGGPSALVSNILVSCDIAVPENVADLRFRGSTSLTRRRFAVAGHRVFAVGDACGYVEPFTGEGMAWAIDAARQAVHLLPANLAQWPADLSAAWKALHIRMIRRQRFCRALRPMMHHPTLAAAGLALGRAAPAVGNWLAAQVGRPTLSQELHGSFG